MTDKILVSRKELDALKTYDCVTQDNDRGVGMWNVIAGEFITVSDLRALLDKAKVSEPDGYKVTGKLGERCSFKSSEVKKGDIIYTTPQPSRIAELEAEIARLKGGNNSKPPTVQAALWTAEDEKRMDIIGQNSNEGLHYDSE